jgi:hypothetical protein
MSHRRRRCNRITRQGFPLSDCTLAPPQDNSMHNLTHVAALMVCTNLCNYINAAPAARSGHEGRRLAFLNSHTLLDKADIKTAVFHCKTAPIKPFFVVHLQKTSVHAVQGCRCRRAMTLEMYLSPPSQRIVTMLCPGPSLRATLTAAHALRAAAGPTNRASFRSKK